MVRRHGLAALLLLSVALCHYGYDPLAQLFGGTGYAARNLFYCLRGFEGVVLFATIGVLAKRPSVSVVCLWGLLEEGQTAACRIAKGIGAPNKTHETFVGLCGNGAYSMGLFVAGLLALAIWYEIGRAVRGPKRP